MLLKGKVALDKPTSFRARGSRCAAFARTPPSVPAGDPTCAGPAGLGNDGSAVGESSYKLFCRWVFDAPCLSNTIWFCSSITNTVLASDSVFFLIPHIFSCSVDFLGGGNTHLTKHYNIFIITEILKVFFSAVYTFLCS